MVVSDHNNNSKTLMASLIERRVPQISGFYIGAGWGLVQFIEWIVERYGLSPHLPDISLVILFSLIPSVVLIAWFHGKPGADSWNKIEKITIPLNLMLTIGLIASFFSVNDLGAATKTMVVTNENGETIQKTVAKKQFRKKIILFNIKNASGNKRLNWLSGGLPMAVQYDLWQTPFVDVVSLLFDGAELYGSLKRAGYPEGTEVPLPLMKKIAIDRHYQYFLNGTLNKEKHNYVVTLHIFQAKTGQEISKITIQDRSLFTLIDKFSAVIKKELDIPDYHMETIQDLPVAEILTNKIEAFKLMVEGIEMMVYKNNFKQAAIITEKAVKIDSRFPLAYLLLGSYYVNTNHSDKAVKAINLALKYDFKLPEYLKFALKEFYYIINGQGKKRLALLKMQAQLNPDNLDVKQKMVNIYIANGFYDKAISEYLDMMDHSVDPEIYLDDIGLVYIRENQLDKAETYLKKYAASFPKEARSFNHLAYLYGLQGKDELVKKNYQASLFLEQDNLFAKLQLASLEEKHGNFSKAFEMYQLYLKQATQPEDRSQVDKKLAELYLIKGQPRKALKLAESSIAEQRKFAAPLSVLIYQLLNMNYYVLAHKEKEGFRLLKNIQSKLQKPFDQMTSMGYALIYLKLKKPQQAKPYIEQFEQTVKKLNGTLQGAKYLPLIMKAELAELQQQHKSALNYFQAYAENTPLDPSRFTDIGRQYRKLSDYENAITTFEKQLKISPYDPYVNYQTGLTYLAMGQKLKARKYFQIAADIWKDAEKDYQYALDNKKLLSQLK